MSGTPRIPCGDAAEPAPTAHKCDDRDRLAKAALRQSLLAARARIASGQKQAWDGMIGAAVRAWWQAQDAGAGAVLGVYWPLRGEPDLRPLYAALAREGVALALPVVLARDAALGFAAWAPGEAMLRDAMGVAVPAEQRLLEGAQGPQALLVPCLGFNAQRFRLGYGGGYYDRTLAGLPRPATAGVAYRCQQAEFASAAHDVALDRVITEAGSIVA